MPRSDKRATKIAFNILGTPGNMKKQKHKKAGKSPKARPNAGYDELLPVLNK